MRFTGNGEFSQPGLAPRGLWQWIEEMLIGWSVVGDRVLKTAEHRRPQFHAVQVPPQALEGLHQIADDKVFCRFGHYYCSFSRAASCEVKALRAVLFPDCRPGICESLQWFGTPVPFTAVPAVRH